jgi:hypothetical protein
MTDKVVLEKRSYYNKRGKEDIEYYKSFFSLTELKGWCKIEALTKLKRAGKKGSALEDIKKALWFVRRWLILNAENANVENKHYLEGGDSFMEFAGVYGDELNSWLKLNAFNMISRAGFKESETEARDMKASIWYLETLITNLEKENARKN